MFGTARLGTLPLGAASTETTQNASGFTSSNFGLAIAASRQDCPATGFIAGNFGTPNVYPGYVPGFSTAALFGTALGRQYWQHVNAGPTGVISRAYYAFQQNPAASGMLTSTFGTPAGARRKPGSITACQAFGFSSTMSGTPSAASRQIAVATGLASTTFGTPTYTRSNARLATGLYAARFGRPRAVSRFGVRYASGFSASAFGTPAAAPRSRVTSIGSPGMFGTPLLFRSTTC